MPHTSLMSHSAPSKTDWAEAAELDGVSGRFTQSPDQILLGGHNLAFTVLTDG